MWVPEQKKRRITQRLKLSYTPSIISNPFVQGLDQNKPGLIVQGAERFISVMHKARDATSVKCIGARKNLCDHNTNHHLSKARKHSVPKNLKWTDCRWFSLKGRRAAFLTWRNNFMMSWKLKAGRGKTSYSRSAEVRRIFSVQGHGGLTPLAIDSNIWH